MSKTKPKVTRIPWWMVPLEILEDIYKTTGLDPRTMNWLCIDHSEESEEGEKPVKEVPK